MRRYYGFDKPVYTRYGLWLWNVLHSNLGGRTSIRTRYGTSSSRGFPISMFLGSDADFS